MRIITIVQVILASCLLSACNLTSGNRNNLNPPTIPKQLFAIDKHVKLESLEDIFYLNESTKQYVRSVTKHSQTQKEQLQALIEAIFNRGNIALIYQSNANNTAQQTFDNREANCLSLTIMTFAMLQELNIDTTFQEVLIPEFWTNRDGNTLINRHVNLVSTVSTSNSKYFSRQQKMTVDFNPSQRRSKLKSVELDKHQIVSFFYSNKGAEYLIKNDYKMAYQYLTQALVFDNKNQSAYLNLGVLLTRSGHDSLAGEFYKYAIHIAPDLSSAYENLAILYNKIGLHEEAKKLLDDLHKQRSSNPYYHYMLGQRAVKSFNFEQAIKHYNDAIKINPEIHEVYAALASVYYKLDYKKQSRMALIKAKTTVNDISLAEKYSAKLDLLF